MRNEALVKLDGLVGHWDVTLSGAWFLDSLETQAKGTSDIEWLGDAFLVNRWQMGDVPPAHFVIGRSDANDRYEVLYHDERGVCRRFGMTWTDDGEWTLLREDPDFHQRFIAAVEPDRIVGRWEASEDEGQTWRKDFDLVFERGA